VAAAGCSPSHAGVTTSVVVGVQSEPLNGTIGTLHVVTTLAGAPGTDETLAPSALPHEVHLVPPGGDATAAIAVEVDGYTSPTWTPGSPDPPVLVRTAETTFVPDETRLLRVMLQGACLLPLPGGPPAGPVCDAPQTCIGGVCQSDQVPAQALEPYASGWASEAPDICKPIGAGSPVVQVGTGQSDYLPLTDGQTVQMEQGPQGGHHIWIAVRQENLKQAGSITTITSVQTSTGLSGPKMAFVFDFEEDQGGFCKLAGLRYQLDIDGTDYHQFLGQPLSVTVVIADSAGATGTGVANVNVAPTILCATGLESDAGGGC